MAPRLSGQTSIFGVVFFVSKSLLEIEEQKKLEKFAILTRKPRSHARILIYRTWPIPPIVAVFRGEDKGGGGGGGGRDDIVLNVAWVRFRSSAICELSVLLVLVLLRGFFFSRFSAEKPSTKTNISKFQFHLDRRPS